MSASEPEPLRSVGRLPPRFLQTAMVCESRTATIFGGERGEFLPGDPKLFEQEAAAFRFHSDGSAMQRLAIGPGVVLDASQPAAGVIYVARAVWSPDAPERGFLGRSTDGGTTWEDIETAPNDIIGVEFASEMVGYVWSSRTIYHTKDGGSSWAKVEAPGLLPRASPRPVLGTDGMLWVAVGQGTARNVRENAIAQVSPDLRVQTLPLNTGFRIWEIDASRDGTLWLLAEGVDSIVRLLRVPPDDSGAVSPVAEFAGDTPKYLHVLGPEIVVLVSKLVGDDLRRTLMVSRDLGATWTEVSKPEPTINAVCALATDRFWLVGSSGRVYQPG